MPSNQIDKNKALLFVIWGEIICLIFTLIALNSTSAIIVSAILLLLIIAIVVTLFISILYKGLGTRKPKRVAWLSVVSIFNIIVLFADLHRWIGLKDTVKASTEYPFLDALYFSVVTWTTLGYGDVVPCPLDRPIAAMEAVMGYLVMALLIAVLVPILQEARTRNAQKPGTAATVVHHPPSAAH